MKTKKYEWRNGFQSQKVDATKVAQILEKLPEVTPAAVLESARSQKSPMHKLFTWEDTDAAHKWRLHQARQVIGALQVTYIEGPVEPVKYMHATVRASKGDTRYNTVDEILSKRDTRNQLLNEALRELSSFRRKYAMLSELANLIPFVDAEIENIRKQIANN